MGDLEKDGTGRKGKRAQEKRGLRRDTKVALSVSGWRFLPEKRKCKRQPAAV